MRKVAIVARAGTAVLAPFRDKEWEIWGLPWISYPRVDRNFDIHSQQFYEEIYLPRDEWLKEGKWRRDYNARCPDVPVYCDPSRFWAFNKPHDFGLDEVAKSIPTFYFENSIAYMIARAIHEEADEIGLWGVHMFASDEATMAAASVLYMIGVAQGRGITVTVAPGSPLFASSWVHGRYGAGNGPNAIRKKFTSFAGVEPYE